MILRQINKGNKVKYYSKYILIILILVSQLLNSCSDSQSVVDELSYTEKIDKICDSIINATGQPGMIVGVWDPDKNFTYVKGIGLANISESVPMSPDMIFKIASNTKSFVIQEILLLAQEEKLRLSDRLSKYFPDYPNSDKMTLEMLCNMSSGIIDYMESNELTAAFFSNPLKVWTPEEMIQTTAKVSLLFTPGTNYHYSSINSFFLGLIIEKLRNKPIDQVLDEHYFKPLGLTKTSFLKGNLLPANAIHGYINFSDPNVFDSDFSEIIDMSWAWSAGAIASDIFDLKDWITYLIDGDLLNEQYQQSRFKSPDFETTEYKYAMGIETYGNDIWGHSGTLPGYTSTMMRSKTNGYTVIIFYNFYDYYNEKPKPISLFFRITKVLYPNLTFSPGLN